MNYEDIDWEEMNLNKSGHTCSKLQNSDIVKGLDKKLSHLYQPQRDELLILEYEHLFPDMPTRTDNIYHDVDIEGSKPIKQRPYKMNPMKLQYLREEIQYFWTMTLLSLVKVIGVLLVFLCQNQMELFVCAQT